MKDADLCLNITEQLLGLVVAIPVTLDSINDTMFDAMQVYLLVMEAILDKTSTVDVTSIGLPLIQLSTSLFAAFEASTASALNQPDMRMPGDEISVSNFFLLSWFLTQ